MDHKRYYIDSRRLAYLELIMARFKVRETRPPVTRARCTADLRLQRCRLLGTGKSLEPFIRCTDSKELKAPELFPPDAQGVELLTNIILPDLYQAFFPYGFPTGEDAWEQACVEMFLRSALAFTACGVNPDECVFDTIIRLAEVYERNTQTYYNLCKMGKNRDVSFTAYYGEQLYELWKFLQDHPFSPFCFAESVSFALACFLGKLYAA